MFENIKVGDVVYKYIKVRSRSVFKTRDFQIAAKVTKVTKTRFQTQDGSIYSKKDGWGYGKTIGQATLTGIDNTKDVERYEENLKKLTEIQSILDRIRVPQQPNDDKSENLDKIIEMLNFVKESFTTT
jgi:hypothetical protein